MNLGDDPFNKATSPKGAAIVGKARLAPAELQDPSTTEMARIWSPHLATDPPEEDHHATVAPPQEQPRRGAGGRATPGPRTPPAPPPVSEGRIRSVGDMP